MIYTQACQAVSNHVHVVTMEQFLSKDFQAQFQSTAGLVVDIVGGLYDIELIGLPAATAKGLGMHCFPANTKNYVTTHDKLLGKHLAQTVGLRIARTISGDDLDHFEGPVIQKPICGGDSFGITQFDYWKPGERPPVGSFIEEFVLGQDATFHLIRNSDAQTYKLLDHIITTSEPEDWFDATMKGDANRLYSQSKTTANRQRYKDPISSELLAMFRELMTLAGLPFIGRVDVRQSKSPGEIGIDDVKFLELNVAPTISNANNWLDGIEAVYKNEIGFKNLLRLPIHPAAKSLATMLREFYAQSLSMQGNKEV